MCIGLAPFSCPFAACDCKQIAILFLLESAQQMVAPPQQREHTALEGQVLFGVTQDQILQWDPRIAMTAHPTGADSVSFVSVRDVQELAAESAHCKEGLL